MKKTILIAALVLAVVAVVGVGAGAVFAQDVTPPYGEHGPMMNGEGPLHTFMVVEWAKKLDLNVNDINTRLAAGESMYDIALSSGVTAEEFPAVMTEVRTNAVNAGVTANVITQEWACVPRTGMPNSLPASTFDVAEQPPTYEARLADKPPSIPCALRSPNSRTASPFAAKQIRAALVAISV